MEFRVGHVTARCPKCDAVSFEEELRPGGPSRYRCASCHSEVSYSELILQIGKLSASRSRLRLATVRAPGAKPGEPVSATVTQPVAAFLLRATRSGTSRG